MEWNNSVLERPKTKKSYDISGHKNKLRGFQSSKSLENTEQVDEFTEEDVWGVVETESNYLGFLETGTRSIAVCRKASKEGSTNSNTTRRMKIPRGGNHHDENGGTRVMYQSAPVNIPDWSQILERENFRGTNETGDDYRSDDDNNGDGDYEERIPPHEVIAKQLARSQLTSFSVYEGAGRTLKGRDLSRVRNAVWTRTGFIG